MAKEGENIMEHLTKKYGARATQSFGDPNSSLMKSGRAVGIEFTLDRNIYPTVRAHALMEYVKETDNDKANAIMEELYIRYFTKGENINNVDLLMEIAAKFGVDEKAALLVMLDDAAQKKVLSKDQSAKRSGIHGVPFYIIDQNNGDDPVTFSGAYPANMIAEMLEEASKE
jgi:predicted DsbA family dithiol-disulfide isomerase